MSDMDERLKLNEKKDQTEKAEGKRGVRLLSQVIALIICLLISFTVWLAVHYREDRKDEPVETGGEAFGGYSDVTSVL